MAEEEKQQVGDGADNYGQAASQMAKAAGQSGQAAAKQAGKEVRLSPRLQPVQPLAVHGEPFCLHSGRSATPCLKYLSFYACCYCFSL